MWKSSEDFLLKDKYIGPLVKKYESCMIRPKKKKDYFDDLVEAIASQQLSGKAAKTIFGRLKEKAGGKLTPESILKIKDEEIRACGMSWAKARYVKDLADKVKSQKLKIKSFDKLSDEEVMKELIVVKGIGRWTAEMFLMFSLARPDIFPADDLGIRNGLKKLLKKDLKPLEMDAFSVRWKPHRTVASWFIWRSLENR